MDELNLTQNGEFCNFQQESADKLSEKMDSRAEKILAENTKNPVGRLLNMIAQMPEVRQKKVLTIRRRLSQGSYKLENRLDITLDRMLEELII